eukprot:CAMPEP_0174694696 /NCGR_PEP_ID=MMETSP1094-20130205/1237_1 /TAXON_ID=156173 /ORGANISM="Chrysochromulina brevifilum, Strain UTEX LB 985" /LENGTH=76 /DNA_ID=CAMNT_0015891009 /DNA_START=334 /DNA_END=564 /DNA_ORIENTATION=+
MFHHHRHQRPNALRDMGAGAILSAYASVRTAKMASHSSANVESTSDTDDASAPSAKHAATDCAASTHFSSERMTRG